MGRRGFGRKPKDKFADLPQTFKDAVQGMNREELRQRLATVTLNHVELMEARKKDEDLKEKAEAYKEASRVYREGAKQFKLQSEYIKQAIDSKGGDTASTGPSAAQA